MKRKNRKNNELPSRQSGDSLDEMKEGLQIFGRGCYNLGKLCIEKISNTLEKSIPDKNNKVKAKGVRKYGNHSKYKK